MALILLDGMEDLSTFVQVQASTGVVAGRTGNALNPNSTNSLARYIVLPSEESATFTAGFAVKFATTTTCDFFEFRSDAGATSHVCLRIVADGSIYVGRNNGVSFVQLAFSGTGVIVAGTWHYVELQATLHDTTGSVTVRVDGIQVATATNVDTRNAGTKTVFDSVLIRNYNPTTAQPAFDDFYLMNGAGDAFLGDIVVETLYPNGNGNANQWLGSDGDSLSNYLLVDEPTPVATDYVASSTTGHQDLYALTDLVRSLPIVGVCHQALAARVDSVARQIKIVNRRTTDTKSAAIDLATTLASYHYALAVDPETSAAWTVANVNALQSGVEVV